MDTYAIAAFPPGIARLVASLALSVWLVATVVPNAGAEVPDRRNGFVLSPVSIAVDEIRSGGPPRDGIPALYEPEVQGVVHAPWSDDERVVGISWEGGARAYPISILVWHELVNDTIEGRPILVSYCPLCGTALVFDRRLAGGVRRFGVSGLLYRSDLLMYDRETESLWSQISFEAVAGPSMGLRLTPIRSKLVRLGEWKRAHPNTTVLSPDTGHARRYGISPYGDYATSNELLFPVKRDRRYHPKTPTVGLRLPGGAARAYPRDEVEKAGGRVEDRFLGHVVRIEYDADSGSFDVSAPSVLEVVEGYWFAWLAFHPDSEVFKFRGPDPG